MPKNGVQIWSAPLDPTQHQGTEPAVTQKLEKMWENGVKMQSEKN